MRKSLQPDGCANLLYSKMEHGGVLLTTVGSDGKPNVMTIGWFQFGRVYHGHPMVTVAVTPLRYSWHLLEQVSEFVLAVPTDEIASAAELCGTQSGRDMDKFQAAGLTPIPSYHVKPPSIRECPMNFECRVYHAMRPPHNVLTPEHRKRPLQEQHTIYFAEALGIYAGE